jgi:hypothetical protein
MDDRAAIAATLRRIGASITDLADLMEGNVPGDSSLIARQIACLREFDVPPENGLSRPEASAAFRKHGLNPRAFGSWVQGGHLAREDDRRWLTDKGRQWADGKLADQHVRATIEQNTAEVLSRVSGGFSAFTSPSTQPPSAS